MNSKVYIGVDIGSATVKIAGINDKDQMVGQPVYLRHDQFPTQVDAVKNAFQQYLNSISGIKISGVGITGSGRELNRHIIGGDLTRTEIFAHYAGVQHLINKGQVNVIKKDKAENVNKIGTIIEIGGQDSKIIIFDASNIPVYFNMNTICSAGTGEFLKQIADEAGIALTEFGAQAILAKYPARIDSTCTVFSRRDFRHLTQKGVDLSERLAGICNALVNNYLNNVAKGFKLPSPVFFQGGVAYNKGVKKAFEDRLGTELIVPPYHDIIGALGMAVIVREEKMGKKEITSQFKEDFFNREYDSQIRYCHGCQNACELSQPLEKAGNDYQILDTLGGRCEGSLAAKNVKEIPQSHQTIQVPINRVKSDRVNSITKVNSFNVRSADGIYFAGIDGGSRGTKYALIKGIKNDIDIIKIGSVDTSGDAIKAILTALIKLERYLPQEAELGGIGTTGSAGELARDIVTTKTKNTADVKTTEIIAHTRWAKHMVPNVKVIMDIGGNDAKIITVNDHGIEFAMNDKCAAGAGAFVEAVAKRFEVPLDQFGEIALSSNSPARISGRCAVFGESDIIHKSRAGFPTRDLFMGLAYSLCRTYLSDIGKGKVLSVPIVAQGGTFLNQAVQKAFHDTLQVSEEEFILAKDPKLVIGAGALGAALASKDAYQKGYDTSFKGFDYILSSYYDTKTLTCTHPSCERTCHGLITLMENGEPIAGYKSINCDFGLFDGLIEDHNTKQHITKIMDRGSA